MLEGESKFIRKRSIRKWCKEIGEKGNDHNICKTYDLRSLKLCSFKLKVSNNKGFFLSGEQDIFFGQENFALLISDHVVSV